MEKEEKGRERDGDCECEGEEMEKEEEFMGIKLKRAVLVRKRGGAPPDTPPPSWSFVGSKEDPITNKSSSSTSVTARQLGANLWEILPQQYHPLSNMSMPTSSRLRRNLKHKPPPQSESDDHPHQPGSTGSFHRQIVESLRRHHGSVNRNGHAIQPVSPASFSSSMEVTPYNGGGTPSSSVELKGRIGDSNYSLKTSTELLKVLNRIWMLEEQHTSNSSLVGALKTELGNSRTRIKNLLKEKQVDRQVIDDLMKQVAQEKLARKNTEQGWIKPSLQSVRDKLEQERKLRKRSESLHRKLALELSNAKSSFSKGMSELERERRARLVLEDLCDEFAMGIRDYDKEKEDDGKERAADSLVLHMSEVWLDERVKAKLAEESKGMVVEKLSSEIEAFLNTHSNIRRRSLESFHLNEAPSAPNNNNADDDGESVGLFDESHGMLMLAGPTSPVNNWEPMIGLRDGEVKENTLKAKLMEARLQWLSHSKASKG